MQRYEKIIELEKKVESGEETPKTEEAPKEDAKDVVTESEKSEKA